MANRYHLVFPHQLFESTEVIPAETQVVLVEEFLFFRQYHFHKQKLVFHRAGLKFYEHYLKERGFEVLYIESTNPLSDIRLLISDLVKQGAEFISCIDPCDNWLTRRIKSACLQYKLGYKFLDNPGFLLSEEEINGFFGSHKRYFQTEFYIHFRRKKEILMDQNGHPLGGKWSFDSENRLKYPASQTPPGVYFPEKNQFHREAENYILSHFPENPGTLGSTMVYPTTFADAKDWLNQFLNTRFHHFGPYEDAIVQHQVILHHSVLSPLLNSGLLSPAFVLDQTISYAQSNQIPIASLEGFVRQVLGWREFIRAVYIREGSKQRTTNFWKFQHPIPKAFYNGTTGIKPLDTILSKTFQTAYNHHIERLMVLGNFMLLCEIHPDEVYRWFMEMYIDAYDWVMVPNVYGMSQFADGGMMCTKPYISGSNYLLKMSNFEKSTSWTELWDALFWRFLHQNRSFFLSNPRLGMLIRTWDKQPEAKRTQILLLANTFLNNFHQHD
ncbi:MAG: cryptochrome/photolyase family protein [Bacteroidia bacterium]|nr:cryptochrome/photolyase family protein [Bacteroidia bacterium]